MRRFLWLAPLAMIAAFHACGGDSSGNPDGGDASMGNDSGPPSSVGESVLQRNHHATRDAQYTQSTFTSAGVATMKLDATFDGAIAGHVYGQVLYVDNIGLGTGATNWVIAVTENNQVTALDANTGGIVWQKIIGPNAASTGAGCGNVNPLGITGTPVIDAASRTMFLDAAIGTKADGSGTIKTHEIHALSIDDGTERPNFPVDAATASFQGTTFDPPVENERGALAFVNGTIYVPYGGHSGDCAQYHGWILGIPYPAGGAITAYATSIAPNTRAAGIWAPGGIASDGTNLYVSTGNTFGSNTWIGQEAIIELGAGPTFSMKATDYFAPHDWLALDNNDVDIGGSGAILIHAPSATPSNLVAALGKNGMVYLLDASNLGGIATAASGDGLFNAKVASGEIINAAATVTTSAGNTWLVAHGYNGATGVGCKKGAGDLIAMKISGSPPTASVEWCADSQTVGEPMITTSDDGGSNALVWFVGQHLNAWDVETGNQVYKGTDGVSGIRLFTSPIAAKGRIYIGADNKVYSFHP